MGRVPDIGKAASTDPRWSEPLQDKVFKSRHQLERIKNALENKAKRLQAANLPIFSAVLTEQAGVQAIDVNGIGVKFTLVNAVDAANEHQIDDQGEHTDLSSAFAAKANNENNQNLYRPGYARFAVWSDVPLQGFAWVRVPEPEALGAHPGRAPRSSVGVCSQEPPLLRSSRSTGRGGPDATHTLRCGTSGPLLPSTRPITNPCVLIFHEDALGRKAAGEKFSLASSSADVPIVRV
eukprot:6211944-Pleurochrysis_carterae.AAC.1